MLGLRLPSLTEKGLHRFELQLGLQIDTLDEASITTGHAWLL